MTLLSFQGRNRKCRDSHWLCRCGITVTPPPSSGSVTAWSLVASGMLLDNVPRCRPLEDFISLGSFKSLSHIPNLSSCICLQYALDT